MRLSSNLDNFRDSKRLAWTAKRAGQTMMMGRIQTPSEVGGASASVVCNSQRLAWTANGAGQADWARIQRIGAVPRRILTILIRKDWSTNSRLKKLRTVDRILTDLTEIMYQSEPKGRRRLFVNIAVSSKHMLQTCCF